MSFLFAIAVGTTGCSTTGLRSATSATELVPVESGFLTDYSQLQPSEQFPAVKMYRDEGHKGGYRKLLFRTVEVWRGSDRRLDDVPEADLQYMADALYQAVTRRLDQSFEMVDKPGPGVLEIHLAFTLVTNEKSPIDFFSTTVPVKALTHRTTMLEAPTKLFLRDCALEFEFSEGVAPVPGAKKRRPMSVVRAAFFDARRGKDSPRGAVETWSDVDAVFEKWAGVLGERFSALRDGTFKPRLTVATPPIAAR